MHSYHKAVTLGSSKHLNPLEVMAINRQHIAPCQVYTVHVCGNAWLNNSTFNITADATDGDQPDTVKVPEQHVRDHALGMFNVGDAAVLELLSRPAQKLNRQRP